MRNAPVMAVHRQDDLFVISHFEDLASEMKDSNQAGAQHVRH
jgi:hypothetical protein